MPAHRDAAPILALAIASAAVLAGAVSLRLFVSPALAPRVNVRWTDTVSEPARAALERELMLLAGERIEGPTWAYDLGDPSARGIDALVTHPSIADTHHIDREERRVSADAPAGRTRIRGGLSVWRDSPSVLWVVRLSFAVLMISALWLATTGRSGMSGIRSTPQVR